MLDGVRLSREAFRFLLDGCRFYGWQTRTFRGAAFDAQGTAIEWLRARYGIDLVCIPAGVFVMGSPLSRSWVGLRTRINIVLW